MIEEKEYKGEWQIPGDDVWHNGVLKFSPDKRTNLEIYGSFNNGLFDRNAQQIIIGKTSQGDITLVDSHYRSTKHTHATGVTIVSTRQASCQSVIISQANRKYCLDLYHSDYSTYSSIGCVTGTKFHSARNKAEYKIEYVQPSSMRFNYFENCDGEIVFNNSTSLTPHQSQD